MGGKVTAFAASVCDWPWPQRNAGGWTSRPSSTSYGRLRIEKKIERQVAVLLYGCKFHGAALEIALQDQYVHLKGICSKCSKSTLGPVGVRPATRKAFAVTLFFIRKVFIPMDWAAEGCSGIQIYYLPVFSMTLANVSERAPHEVAHTLYWVIEHLTK